jgi:cysteine desulfurase
MDHSATTYVRPEVVDAMAPYFSEVYGNPSSIHHMGRHARYVLDECRDRVAECMKVDPKEVIFTGGGSEGDNFAIVGTALALQEKGNHIITSQIEHHAVLHTCEFLESQGFEVTYLPVDQYGLVDPEVLEESITDRTILVSIMSSNNEVGTIQDLEALAGVCYKRGVRFHTDSVQSIGLHELRLNELPIDLATFTAHKFYGPKGVGVMIRKLGTKIKPIIWGGAQEFKLRAGTENLAGIVGLTKALELAISEQDANVKRLTALRDKLISGILTKIPDTHLNGHPTRRLAHNANISFNRVEGEGILLKLDFLGVCASSGSACTSASLEPSHVLRAMGVDPVLAHGSIRMTLGKCNTEEDIDFVVAQLPPIVEQLRAISAVY